MSLFEDVAKELKLTDQQIKDKDIARFVTNVVLRKQSKQWFQYWNGKIKNFYAKFIIKET